MKKLILSIVSIAATSLASFADTSLAEAYNGLAALSGMSESTSQTIQVNPSVAIKNVKTSSVNVSSGDAQSYREKFIYMMENLPVRDMVIGANNMRELAAVYTTPAGNGQYNVLVVTGNTLDGNFSVSYGQTSKAGVNAMKASIVNMDKNKLAVTTITGSGNHNLVGMNR